MKKLIRILSNPIFYKLAFLLVFSSIFIGSCVTTKKSTYLQEYVDSDYTGIAKFPEDYRIQASDNLFIRVVTPDPILSNMFNTMPVSVPNTTTTEQSTDLISYEVYSDGTVEIPYLGFIPVEGKTLIEAKQVIEAALGEYVTDAAITVKLVNNYVSILGEVNLPGKYLIYKSHLNIFEALSMAGDVADYGNRYELSIVRTIGDSILVKDFDITDKALISSEFFFVMPNDVIYAKPLKGKFFAMNQFPYALILSTITTFILLMNYIE